MKNSSLLLPGCSNRSKRTTRASGNSNKLSLAQRMGIVDLPEPPLSSEQWTAIERLAVERNHVSDPCPICMEPLGVKEKQMILDCSHIFHIDCFRNFERFTRMNMDAKLQCPMCRKEEYKKRITGEARKVYLHLCAVRYVVLPQYSIESSRSLTYIHLLRIQSLWRGYRTRRMFRKDLLKRNPVKKREYYAKKIHTLNEKLISHQLAQDRAVDQLLLQTEYNLQKSRLSYLDEDKWHIIYQKALARGYDACPICMCDMDDSTKPCVITSCTHCFHAQCLSSFESFNPMVNRLSCPSCRAPYLKRNMSSFVS